MMKTRISAVCLLLAGTAYGREPPEHLVQTLPPGFVSADVKTQKGTVTEQFLAAPETLQGWSRKITIQSFYFTSGHPPPPSRYVGYLEQSWSAGCPAADKPVSGTGFDVSGRMAATVELDCPENPATKKPEHTLFQIVLGTNALYVAQYAFRHEPNAVERSQALAYLKSVHLEGTAKADIPDGAK